MSNSFSYDFLIHNFNYTDMRYRSLDYNEATIEPKRCYAITETSNQSTSNRMFNHDKWT